MERQRTEDLELKEIGQYYGTEQYHKVPFYQSVLTDGVMYVAENGYSWLITDALSLIDYKKFDSPFLAIKFKRNEEGKGAVASYEDGNGKVFHTQKYTYTDAKADFTMYWTNNVLMLSGEY